MRIGSKSLRRAGGSVLASLLRKRLRRELRADPRRLTQIEAALTAFRNGRYDHDSLAFSPDLGGLARHCYELAPEAFFHALLRAHRVNIGKVSTPVLRRYRLFGIEVEHDIRNTAEWSAYLLGDHDPGVRYWLQQYAGTNGIVVDIGANVGLFSLPLARSVQPAGLVYAFEPNPATAARLQAMAESNGLAERIAVQPIALGAQAAVSQLSVPAINEGSATLLAISEAKERFEVRIEPFSQWWEAAGRPRVDVIKIDVEGHEGAVIEGMLPFLDQQRPPILLELSPAQTDCGPLLEQLRRRGYRILQVLPTPPYVRPLPSTLPDQLDVLCEPAAEQETPA